jgi:predicted RNA-binding Zn-ribbon protein involved in translation (DUF1610 family)
MARLNPEQEKQRLEKLYAAMEDAELAKLSHDWLGLARPAKDALRAEMVRRGMDVAEVDALERGEIPGPEPEPVVIRQFRDLPEAMIAQSLLDSAGIENFLSDENVVRMDWLWSNAIGGVKLLVRKHDAEEAERLLSEKRPAQFEIPDSETYVQPTCPKCGSMEVTYDGLDRPLSYATVAVGVPIPVKNAGWRCASCKNRWTDEAGAGTV